jgi:hypothetical protein
MPPPPPPPPPQISPLPPPPPPPPYPPSYHRINNNNRYRIIDSPISQITQTDNLDYNLTQILNNLPPLSNL